MQSAASRAFPVKASRNQPQQSVFIFGQSTVALSTVEQGVHKVVVCVKLLRPSRPALMFHAPLYSVRDKQQRK